MGGIALAAVTGALLLLRARQRAQKVTSVCHLWNHRCNGITVAMVGLRHESWIARADRHAGRRGNVFRPSLPRVALAVTYRTIDCCVWR